ncbi:hypothetical protein GWI33_016561 [Rhynchophorus ferrugineus]|uniref:Uncharacterized protein n=1 Tax=Rhynchophorus ferrugineus TaxID=354439 RepID=A0A834I1E7_RHYFE|nr:hypothetical protein GWI33_016561 [Rhynchophorus ferrugineus]
MNLREDRNGEADDMRIGKWSVIGDHTREGKRVCESRVGSMQDRLPEARRRNSFKVVSNERDWIFRDSWTKLASGGMEALELFVLSFQRDDSDAVPRGLDFRVALRLLGNGALIAAGLMEWSGFNLSTGSGGRSGGMGEGLANMFRVGRKRREEKK